MRKPSPAKIKRLSHTNIEYAVNQDGTQGYGWNFYPGCQHKEQGICLVPHCLAESMAKRFGKWGDFHKPHLVPELLLAPLRIRKPSTILVNFMGDLGGDWVDPNQQVVVDAYTKPTYKLVPGPHALASTVFQTLYDCPQHRFLFLSKNPSAWIRWGHFPDNAYVGFTACNQKMLEDGLTAMKQVYAKHKWISFEPVMENLKPLNLTGYDFAAIGGMDNGKNPPGMIEWVKEIIVACQRAGVRYWVKNNLRSLLGDNLHQDSIIGTTGGDSGARLPAHCGNKGLFGK